MRRPTALIAPSWRHTIRRWSGPSLGVLLVLSCCWWSGLWMYVTPLRILWAHHLDHVEGKAELLVPGQHRPQLALRAPDGRRLVLETMHLGQRERFIWDLVADQRLPLPQRVHDLAWLDPNYLAMISDGYQVVDARDGSAITVEPSRMRATASQEDGRPLNRCCGVQSGCMCSMCSADSQHIQ